MPKRKKRRSAESAAAPPPEPAPAPPKAPNPLADRWLWIILAVAALMRLPTLAVPSMWFDEIRTQNIIEFERNPLSHYGFHWIESFFYELPLPADISLRLFPALCGLLGIALIYVVAFHLAGRAAGRWAALLVTLNEFDLFFSQEARFYSAMFAFTALAWLLTQIGFARRQWLWLPAALAVAAAAVTIHPTQEVFLGVLGVYIFGVLALTPSGIAWLLESMRPKNARGDLRPQAFLAYAIVIVCAGFGAAYANHISKLVMSTFAFNLNGFWRAIQPRFLASHLRDYGAQFEPGFTPGGLYFFAFAIIFVWGVVEALRRWPRDAALGLMTIFGTFAAVKLYKDPKPYEVKYSFYIFPFMAVFAAQGLEACRVALERALARAAAAPGRAAKLAALALLAVVVGFSGWACARYYRDGKINEKSAIKVLMSEWKPGDRVVSYGHTNFAMGFYWDLWKLPPERWTAMEWEGSETGEYVVGRLKALAREGARTWFVDSWSYDDPPAMRTWLDAQAKPVQAWPSSMGQPVRLYLLTPAPLPAPPLKIDAFDCIPGRQALHPHAKTVAGRIGLVVEANAAFDYDFSIPQTGSFMFALEALNPRAVQAWWLVEVDGKAAGMLAFDAYDDTWARRQMRMDLDAGRHRITLHWVSDSVVNAELEDQPGLAPPVQAALGTLELTPGFSGADDSLLDPRPLVEQGDKSLLPLAAAGAKGRLDAAWKYDGPGGLGLAKTSGGADAAQFQIPADADPEQEFELYYAKPLPDPTEGMVYVEAEVRTRHLFNHAVNMKVTFIDGSNSVAGWSWVQRVGLSDAMRYSPYMDDAFLNDWVVVGGLVQIPRKAKSWAPAVTIYAQGHPLARADATVWVRNVRISPAIGRQLSEK